MFLETSSACNLPMRTKRSLIITNYCNYSWIFPQVRSNCNIHFYHLKNASVQMVKYFFLSGSRNVAGADDLGPPFEPGSAPSLVISAIADGSLGCNQITFDDISHVYFSIVLHLLNENLIHGPTKWASSLQVRYVTTEEPLLCALLILQN